MPVSGPRGAPNNPGSPFHGAADWPCNWYAIRDRRETSEGFKFLQWDGRKWNVITDWITSDQSIVRPMVEASAAQYAKEKGITPRDCSKEK